MGDCLKRSVRVLIELDLAIGIIFYVQKPTATYQLWNPVRRSVVVDHARRAIGISQVIERSIVPDG